MRYCVLYPNTRNVNLIKEMGMIPYKLHKLYGYDAKIACYKLGEYPYLNNEVKGLKIDFIEQKYNKYSLDGMRYLKENAKDIDILQIFHVTLYSVFYAFTYKKLNPKGKIYLKLDCSQKLVERINSLGKIGIKFLKGYFKKVDLISIEQEELYEKLKKILPTDEEKIIHLPNGVDFDALGSLSEGYFEKKENVILNVARIGAEEKNTPMLLEAFAKIENIHNSGWKLILIGSIEEDFKAYIEDYFKRFPQLKNIVQFKGEIKDRKALYKEYEKAKIFSLTSDFESFAFAFIEAAAFGDVIVSTDVGIAREIIKSDNGAFVSSGDVHALSRELKKYIECDELKTYSEITYNLCREKYDWNKIIEKLEYNLNKLQIESK